MLTIKLIKKNQSVCSAPCSSKKKVSTTKNEFDLQNGIVDNFLEFEDLFRILTLAHRRFVPQLAHL